MKKIKLFSFSPTKLPSFHHDKIILYPLLVSIFLIALQTVVIILKWRFLPPQIPLFFSRPWGEKELSHPQLLWLLPLQSLAILFVNTSFIIILQKTSLPSRLLAYSSCIVVILFTIACLEIIFLTT